MTGNRGVKSGGDGVAWRENGLVNTGQLVIKAEIAEQQVNIDSIDGVRQQWNVRAVGPPCRLRRSGWCSAVKFKCCVVIVVIV